PEEADRLLVLAASQVSVTDSIKCFGKCRGENGSLHERSKRFSMAPHGVVTVAEIVLSDRIRRCDSDRLFISDECSFLISGIEISITQPAICLRISGVGANGALKSLNCFRPFIFLGEPVTLFNNSYRSATRGLARLGALLRLRRRKGTNQYEIKACDREKPEMCVLHYVLILKTNGQQGRFRRL